MFENYSYSIGRVQKKPFKKQLKKTYNEPETLTLDVLKYH